MHARRNSEALVEIERAKDLDPLSLIVRALACFVRSNSGQNDQAAHECEEVVKLDHQFAPGHYFLGVTLMRQNKYEDAIAQFRTAVALSNGSPIMECALGVAYAHAGRHDEARRLLKELERKTDGTYVSPYGFAQIFSVLGEQDRALTALDHAVDEHSYELLFLRIDHSFDSLHGNRRFERIVTKIGFPS
jgi:tetratricopeptide (TPR) repeat protein